MLATLWPVADASTGKFMQALYRIPQAPGITTAEALRQAQLRFIRGEDGGAPELAARGMKRDVAHASAPADPTKPYAHPFYWAPFILMGNWL